MVSPVGALFLFLFYLYYSVNNETIYFLGLVHERRHPDFLKKRQSNVGGQQLFKIGNFKTRPALFTRILFYLLVF
jgi:hypothetical protein